LVQEIKEKKIKLWGKGEKKFAERKKEKGQGSFSTLSPQYGKGQGDRRKKKKKKKKGPHMDSEGEGGGRMEGCETMIASRITDKRISFTSQKRGEEAKEEGRKWTGREKEKSHGGGRGGQEKKRSLSTSQIDQVTLWALLESFFEREHKGGTL